MARFLDDRGRLFGKVNIVDLLVFLVIVAVVVFAALRFTTKEPETVPVRLTLLVKSVDNRLVESFTATGAMQDSGGALLGTIESAEATPSQLERVTDAGALVAAPSSTASDVLIVVLGDAEVFDSTAHVGRLAARVGTRVSLVGPGYETDATIVGVVWGAGASQ